jgi:hypothetical protein
MLVTQETSWDNEAAPEMNQLNDPSINQKRLRKR